MRYVSHVEIVFLNVTQSKELNAKLCSITSPFPKFVTLDYSWSSQRTVFMLLLNMPQNFALKGRGSSITQVTLIQLNTSNYSVPNSWILIFLNTWLWLYTQVFTPVTLNSGKVTKSNCLLCSFSSFYPYIKKPLIRNMTDIVSIIKMTSQFLWEQILLKVTATPAEYILFSIHLVY